VETKPTADDVHRFRAPSGHDYAVDLWILWRLRILISVESRTSFGRSDEVSSTLVIECLEFQSQGFQYSLQHVRWLTCRFTLLCAAESAERDIPHKSRVIPDGKVVGSVSVVHLPSTFRMASAWLIAAISRISEREPLGFMLVNRQHQKDFREREALNRDVRDLEHNYRHSDARYGWCRFPAIPTCR